ncbi:MAG: peptide chain release factor-like protein, partial [Clostridiaceae bacterium]|nr:peptide chain release factor-like protein [Clostridiaceae bacterium]
YRMYVRWAERKGYKVKVLDFQPDDEGGINSAAILVEGDYAYGYLKGEKGVHRRGRISPFDSSGRRHTSCASVDVTPEIDDDIQVEIAPDDLRIDTFRSSGAGGQHINKTESAIRITHIPTGTVVECQDERSQHKNKDKAMKILRSRILEAERAKQNEAIAGERKSQVGTGDRSERIRTYNFPQGRVSDHRIGLTLYKIEAIMNGDLDELIDALITADTAEKLKAE